MSIIKTFRDERNKRLPYGDRKDLQSDKAADTAPKIHDLTYLRSLAKDVLNHMQTRDKDLDGNRTWDYCYEVPIGNVLGSVDKATWVFMLESCVNWAIETHSAVQPNGNWELQSFEDLVEERTFKTMRTVGRKKDGTPELMDQVHSKQFLVIGMRFVDVKGEKDLVYEMGRPTTNKQTDNNGLTAEAVKLMMSQMSKGGSVPSAEDQKRIEYQEAELRRQDMELNLLREQQAKSNEIMAGLLAEIQNMKSKQSPAPKATTRSRKSKS